MSTSRQHTPRQPSPSGRLWKDVADERREAIEDLALGRAETRRHVAAQDGTPPDILDRLALDPVASVAAAAVANRWTSEAAIEASWGAAKQASPEYRTAVARGILANPWPPRAVHREAEAWAHRGVPRIFDPDFV